MADPGQIAIALKGFICDELAPDLDVAELDDDDSLLDSGILDSFGIMTLLAFIQQRFGVDIPAEDIEPENFETIATITRTVGSYLQS
jgi:acyl carrier protein